MTQRNTKPCVGFVGGCSEPRNGVVDSSKRDTSVLHRFSFPATAFFPPFVTFGNRWEQYLILIVISPTFYRLPLYRQVERQSRRCKARRGSSYLSTRSPDCLKACQNGRGYRRRCYLYH